MRVRKMIRRTLVAAVLVASGASDAADWIAAADERGAFDATSFVRTFVNAKEVRRAEWKVSGLGVFQAFANGCEIGGFLKPGFTHVAKCRHVYGFDVTDKLNCAAGAKNVLSATVTSGWWRDKVVETPRTRFDWLPFEDELGIDRSALGCAPACDYEFFVPPNADNAFWGELSVTYADGTVESVGTDSRWSAARTGAVSHASIYDGEVYDARVDESWRTQGAIGWPAAKVDSQFRGEMRPAAAEVVLREDLAFAPREMYVVRGAVGAGEDSYGIARIVRFHEDGEMVALRPGEELVVDFGQNAAAVCRFELEGDAGTVMKVRHAEMLNEGGGAKARGNDGPEGTPYVANLRGIPAAVEYTLRDGVQTYRPSYSFFGFRYIGVTASAPMRIRRVRSIPVTSVTREMETGTIETGCADVNRLISNIRWGMYSNYLSVPTDCPQRDERVGWTGDTQAFLGAALYNADINGFLSKWMADIRDSQFENGAFRSVAPVGQCGRSGGMSAWGDAGVIVPYRLWRRYGDLAIVRENWQAMVRHLDCLERNGGHLTVRCGDWLAFEKNDDDVKAYVSSVYFLDNARMMAAMARALGKADEAARYDCLGDKLTAEFRARYLDGQGELRENYRTQTTLMFALKLGLVSGAAFEATKRQLVGNVRAHGNRLQTGFLGTAHLLDVLSDIGEGKLATTLLLQHEEPSWLYSIDQGATTIWERWNSYTKAKGFGPVAMNSFNHYAYGAVLGWMYSSLAGIREDPSVPGMRRFVLAPQPDRRLGFVRASYRSRQGVIRSAWRYDADGNWTWSYTVPEGTVADVRLPDGRKFTRTAGAYEERASVRKVPEEKTLRPIGGLTKAVVSAFVLVLAKDGRLDLDVPVSRYLGGAAFAMTLRECLSCTAGFKKGHPCYPADAFTMDEVLAKMKAAWPAKSEKEPGFVFGPWGYCVAAAVVEKVTGEPFDVVMRREFLDPLGLHDTVFIPSPEQMDRMAPDIPPYKWLTVPYDSKERRAAPDCGLFSTKDDLERFGRWLLADAAAQPFFRKQTGQASERAFSFGFNVLSDDLIGFESATGCSLRVDRSAGSVEVLTGGRR